MNESLCTCDKLDERRAFIREHAMRIDAARLAFCEYERHDRRMFSAEVSWQHARELWDAKPEDC